MSGRHFSKLPDAEQALPEGVILYFARSGGLRPINEELVVREDGHATVTRGIRRQTQERAFAPEEVRQVLGDLVLAGFFEMEPEVGWQAPDGYAYEVTVRSGAGTRTVVTYDGSVPKPLAAVLGKLRAMLRSS